MAEFEIKIVHKGTTVARTYIDADTDLELAEQLVTVAEDFQNGDSDWLEGATESAT
jgi:hypothetical protein